MTTYFEKAILAATLCGGFILPVSAAAQQFPTKTVTIVVGYTAGGAADALARAVAQRLNEAWKVPVVVENKAGANGLVAAQAVANARPDGHSVLLVTDAMVSIDPQLPGPAKWDPSRYLEPVINLATGPLLFAARKDLEVNSIPALAEYGKANPDKLSFGTSGNATPHRLAGEMLQKRGGFQMKHIPYRGTSASVIDLLGGHISLVVGSPPSMESHIKDGKMKWLGVTSEKRFPLIPDVPSIAEFYPGFNVELYFGLMAPNRTPAPIAAVLNQQVNNILALPQTVSLLETLGVRPTGGSAADFRAKIASDLETRGKLIRELEITAD